jgi:hypothetical protein
LALVARVCDEAVGVAESRPANSASQSCDSAVWPCGCDVAGVLACVLPPLVVLGKETLGGGGPAVLPAAEVPESEPKSKLLSVPNVVAAPPA